MSPDLKQDAATMLSDDLTIVLFTSVCIAVCLASFQILDRRGTFRGQSSRFRRLKPLKPVFEKIRTCDPSLISPASATLVPPVRTHHCRRMEGWSRFPVLE